MFRAARKTLWPWLVLCTGALTCGCSLFKSESSTPPKPTTPPLVTPVTPPPPPPAESPAFIELTHRSKTLEEERNALFMQTQQLQSTLVEKDKAIAAATLELQASSAEV